MRHGGGLIDLQNSFMFFSWTSAGQLWITPDDDPIEGASHVGNFYDLEAGLFVDATSPSPTEILLSVVSKHLIDDYSLDICVGPRQKKTTAIP